METTQGINQQSLTAANEPQKWQRVEILYYQNLIQQGSSWQGICLGRSETGYSVLPERRKDEAEPTVIECCPGQIRLIPTVSAHTIGQYWVPVAIYKKYLIDWANPVALDLKLTNGQRAFNCWPKRDAANFFVFNEMDRPHGRYTEHHVTAVCHTEG